MPESTCNTCKKKTDDPTEGECQQCREEITSSQRKRATPCECGEEPTLVNSMMQCNGCDRWWHFACVGLGGITKYNTEKIVNWKCPNCFIFSPKILENLGLSARNEGENTSIDIKNEVKRQITEVIPEIVTEVVGGVKTALGETHVKQMMNQANEKISESWASIAKKHQTKVIGETVEKTTSTALEKSIRLIDANLTEQRKRVRNAVISGIDEDVGEGESLAQVVVNVLQAIDNLSVNDMVACNRLGKKTPGSKRLILVIFKKEDDAMYFHNWGRGRKLAERSWVNPDLTHNEREAMFQAREEKRLKLEQERLKKEEEKRKKEQQRRPSGAANHDGQVDGAATVGLEAQPQRERARTEEVRNRDQPPHTVPDRQPNGRQNNPNRSRSNSR